MYAARLIATRHVWGSRLIERRLVLGWVVQRIGDAEEDCTFVFEDI